MKIMSKRNTAPDLTVETRPRSTMPRVRGALASKATVTVDQIRARAYEIYESRRGGPGDPVADWAQAERELNGGVAVGGAEQRLTLD